MTNSHESFAAIIVLGAFVEPEGNPSESLRRRTLYAINLYKAGLAPIIIASGGIGPNPPSEAEVISRICRENGVPASAIIEERASKTTLENAINVFPLLEELSADEVLIVTDRYHKFRASICFKKPDLKVHFAGLERDPRTTSIFRWTYYYIREFGALGKLWWNLRQRPNSA